MSIERKILKTEKQIERDADQELLASQYTARAARETNQLLREMLKRQHETNNLLRQSLGVQQAEDGFLYEIEQDLHPKRFTLQAIQFQGDNMALVALAPGNVAQFGVVLLNNGTPASASNGNVPASFVLTPTLTFDDTLVTVAPATADQSGGTIPLTSQFLATDGAGDTATSTIGTFTAVDPLGNTQTTTITWAGAVTPPVDGFSLGAVQLV